MHPKKKKKTKKLHIFNYCHLYFTLKTIKTSEYV